MALHLGRGSIKASFKCVVEWQRTVAMPVAAILMSMAGSPVRAAEQPTEVTVPTTELQEVLVTATRRETTVQNTPISITAITGDQIVLRGVSNLEDLVTSVPGLAIRNAGGLGEQEYEIRGLNSQGGNSSMVGVYFGEIPLSSPTSSQLGKTVIDPTLYDVERVEVLRGPQGTLYGSSSMGGAVRVLPNPPQLNTYAASTQIVASGTASGGGFNDQVNGMVNIPLGDTAAVRFVGSVTNQSGWIQQRVIEDGAVTTDVGVYPNVTRPGNFYTAPVQSTVDGSNAIHIESLRAELLWKPTENFTIEPTAMYQLIQQDAPPAVDVDGNPTHPTTPNVLAHWQIYAAPEPQTDSMSLGGLQMVYQLPSFSITSVTGFWHRNPVIFQDATEQLASALGFAQYSPTKGGMGPVMSSKGNGSFEQDYSRQLSQEVRLASTAPGPFQWVVGYYYEDLYSQDYINTLAPQATAIFGGPNLYVGSLYQTLLQNAFYAHLAWRPSSHFEVAAGFRHYHYSNDEVATAYGAFTTLSFEGNTVPYTAGTSTAASGNVPSFTVTYNVDPNHMVYAKVDKGFRLGGASDVTGPIPVTYSNNPNPLYLSWVANECALQSKLLLTSTCNPNILLTAPTTVASDTLWSYELGAKSSFLDHRLILNLAAYLEDWNEPQIATNLAGFGLNVNGGDARIKGIEAELQALLGSGFDLTLNASYSNGTFLEDDALSGYPAGTQIPDMPRAMGYGALHWQHDLATGNGLSVFGLIEASYTGTRTTLPFGVTATLLNMDQLLVHMPSYTLVNLRFGVRGGRENSWSVSAFVNNLTNNLVLVDPQPQIALQTAAFERYVMTQPLTAGIDVTYRFH
jgi:outer membrane receptor protein involved in Fe transport